MSDTDQPVTLVKIEFSNGTSEEYRIDYLRLIPHEEEKRHTAHLLGKIASGYLGGGYILMPDNTVAMLEKATKA